MPEDAVKRQLAQLRSLFTEENLIISIVLDLDIGLEHMRDSMVDGLTTIQEAIAETLQALQGAAPVAAEPGPTNGTGRSGLRTALADAMGRVLGAKKA